MLTMSVTFEHEGIEFEADYTVDHEGTVTFPTFCVDTVLEITTAMTKPLRESAVHAIIEWAVLVTESRVP